MSKTTVLQRTVQEVNEHIDYLKSRKVEFKVHSSQYSTMIEANGVKVRYVTQIYDDRVFMCSRMIKSNLKNRDLDWILKGNFSTNNYQTKPGLKPGSYGKVINIDISGAYPNCLINNKLIDPKTYSFLMDLGKKERLPAIGMIAKKSLIYEYKNGQCVDVTEDNGEFQKVFHFVVYSINQIMRELKDIAADHYLMHWVDGIFLKARTPGFLIKQMEKVLETANYKYKFEKIDDFIITRDEDMIQVQMTKNGIHKDFKFTDQNMVTLYNRIAEKLNGDVLDISGNLDRDIQLPAGVSPDDFKDWFL
jgi:hypothetical protein